MRTDDMTENPGNGSGNVMEDCRSGSGMDIRVLLFVQEGGARQKYLDALADSGAEVFVASSFYDLGREIGRVSYHGLFLDLPTKMKAVRENKAYVYRLVEKFPVAHLQIDQKTGEVRCFYFNGKKGGSPLDFINSQCRNFVPRKIRMDDRQETYLPVLVSKHLEDARPERSITKDLSPGGCFIFSTRRWKAGSHIWIRFRDANNPEPIHARIQTVIRWGETRQIPGIGVQFIDPTPWQVDELAGLLQSVLMPGR